MDTLTWRAGTQDAAPSQWDSLKRLLAGSIQLLREKDNRFIVITSRTNTRYLQFISLDSGSIEGEAVSNHFLELANRLTPTACRRLTDLGWRSPTVSGSGRKNFWIRWPHSAAAERIAAFAVATLRDPLEIASPADLEIRHDAFGSCPATVSEETGQWIPPSENPVVQLRPGLIVRSGITGREYKVGGRLGVGGFGVVYRVTQVSGPAPLPGACVLKIASEPRGWHREAYFGELLRGASGVVQVHESFAWAPRGKGRKPLYCLVSELVEGGDLAHHLERSPEPWPERKARREIIRLLRAVTLLHSAGAVHRDITPLNVFVTADGFLKLGDFGIAQNRIGKRDVPADFFNRRFAPETMIGGKTRGWRPADDIYQLGQLYALLLGGCGKAKLSAQDVKKLSCSPEAKAVIQRCIGLRRKRFASATEMLVRLEKQEAHAPAWASPRSLEGKSVVFTGRLSIGRDAAKRLLINAGGIFEKNVGQRTDFVVVGEPSPHWKGEKEGQKLLDVDHEEEVGHDIALIKGSRFLALVRPVRKSTAH